MLVYFGIRHFYVNQLAHSHQSPHILIHQGQVWDYSPELKEYGVNLHTPLPTLKQLPGCRITPIRLSEYYRYTEEWLALCSEWTEDIELEHPHAWYSQLPEPLSCTEFADHILTSWSQKGLSGLWGSGPSKLVAKLAARLCPEHIVGAEEVSSFLQGVPLRFLASYLTNHELTELSRLGLDTFGELAAVSKHSLLEQFGKRGHDLHRLARGEDLTPFTSRDRSRVSWEMDFLTIPEIEDAIGRPQLDRFLQEGARQICHQLRERYCCAQKIELSWENPEQKNHTTTRKFSQPTDQEDTLERMLFAIAPTEPVTKVALQAVETVAMSPKQLDIFEENPTRQHLKAVKTRLGSNLTELSIARREKILLMWEENHL